MFRNIGFSTGVFFPHSSIPEALRILKEHSVTAVEIGPDFSHPETFEANELTIEDLSSFTIVSHHAPSITYGYNPETEFVFKRIARLQAITRLAKVVVHPDWVEDFSVFKHAPFTVAFENMDCRKQSFKTATEMRDLLEKDPAWEMVFDINHVYTNDRTLRSVGEFIELCGDRITQIHLSGYSQLHDPLFKTRQTELITAIAAIPGQIVVESQLGLDEFKQEQIYIDKLLSSY